MIEVNYFNIACCDDTLGNHFFDGYSFASASDVETYFGLTTGAVTYFDTNKFTTLEPYDIEYSGSGSLLDNSIYRDYWGIIRDIKIAGSGLPRTGVNLYSYNVNNIEDNSFANFSDSTLIFKNVNSIGLATAQNPFVNSSNLFIEIGNFNKISSNAFSDMTDCVIKIGSKVGVKTSSDIYGLSTISLFQSSSNITIYCSTLFASSQIMVDSLAANPSVTLITY